MRAQLRDELVRHVHASVPHGRPAMPACREPPGPQPPDAPTPAQPPDPHRDTHTPERGNNP